MFKKKKAEEDTETEFPPNEEDINRRFAELAQYEKDLKSREAELQQWHSTLSKWARDIEIEREHLSQWGDEIRKIALQVAEEKKMREVAGGT